MSERLIIETSCEHGFNRKHPIGGWDGPMCPGGSSFVLGLGDLPTERIERAAKALMRWRYPALKEEMYESPSRTLFRGADAVVSAFLSCSDIETSEGPTDSLDSVGVDQ